LIYILECQHYFIRLWRVFRDSKDPAQGEKQMADGRENRPLSYSCCYACAQRASSKAAILMRCRSF